MQFSKSFCKDAKKKGEKDLTSGTETGRRLLYDPLFQHPEGIGAEDGCYKNKPGYVPEVALEAAQCSGTADIHEMIKGSKKSDLRNQGRQGLNREEDTGEEERSGQDRHALQGPRRVPPGAVREGA